MSSLRIRVGGVTLALRSRERRLRLPRELRPFAVSRGADIDLTLTSDPMPEPGIEPLLFDSGGLWRVYRHGRGLLYVLQEPVSGSRPYGALVIDHAWRLGTLYAARGAGGVPHPLDEILFQHHVTLHRGVEVHASGIVVDGRAVLFCGTSGAGKTTLTELWRRHRPGATVLSDDRIVVRRRGRIPWAYGTPWHGSGRFASPEGRPLGALFFLRHARRSSASRLTPLEAASRLAARTFPPPWDRRAWSSVLGTCARLGEAVPSYALGIRPDRSAVDVILGALGGS